MTQNEISPSDDLMPPSKRAARRIIQRAFVLTGRDKQFRQHIRELRLTTRWTLEDWDLTWTVIINRGKIEFERRPAKHPDLALNWQTADAFFASASETASADGRMEIEGDPSVRRLAGNLLKTYFRFLGQVLRDPVDDVGESLLSGDTTNYP